MKSLFSPAGAVLIAFGLLGCTAGSGTSLTTQEALKPQTNPRKVLWAFRSEQELDRYLREVAERQKRKRKTMMLATPLAAPAPAWTKVASLRFTEITWSSSGAGVCSPSPSRMAALNRFPRLTHFHPTLILAIRGTTRC